MRPDQDYTREYPSHMPAKITVRLKDGMVRTRTVQGFPGLPSHPFTWQDAVDKFDQLVDERLDHSLSDEIKHAVQSQGGSVGVTSVPGEGSCFTIRLPVEPVEKTASS